MVCMNRVAGGDRVAASLLDFRVAIHGQPFILFGFWKFAPSYSWFNMVLILHANAQLTILVLAGAITSIELACFVVTVSIAPTITDPRILAAQRAQAGVLKSAAPQRSTCQLKESCC